MKKIISLGVLILCLMSVYAQESENLVINPSFEEFKDCPKSYTEEKGVKDVIPGWTTPSGTAPDYFNRCSGGVVGVPSNYAGVAQAKTGNAYMGAILTGTENNYREYIQGELKEPLVAGKQYCVSFYYRLASYSKIAVDQLSLYFSSDQKFNNRQKSNLPYKPQINNPEGLFLNNTKEWEQVCRVYVAKGGEKHFIIGNFKSYMKTNYVVNDKDVVNKRNKSYAYYYFDDVVVRALEDCNDCPCVRHEFEAQVVDSSYTGGRDPRTGTVEKIVNDGHIKVSLVGGTAPYSINWNTGHKGMELKNLAAGTYSYTVKDKYNCKSKGTIVFKKPVVSKNDFEENLQSIEEGQAIVLKNIFFELNKTSLLSESYTELDKVVNFMKAQNISLIEISGHTDSDGSEAYNQKLSEGRAKSVVAYLQSKGVGATSMKAVGYGESKPIDTNLSDDGKAANRRVEFRLLKK